MILKNHLKLYYGSYTKVEIPDLSMCRREKDFGRGFYLTTDRKPALMPEELRKWADYDILIGKIANDNTNPTILAYMNRLFGDVDSETAMNTAINLLLPYRLKNQLCFRTQKALDMLAYTGCEETCYID